MKASGFLSQKYEIENNQHLFIQNFYRKKSKHLIFGLSGLKTPLTQVTAEKHETQELHIKALQTWRRSNKTFASW